MLIPHEEIVRSVTTENPWWQTGAIPERFDRFARRAYFSPFRQLASRWEVNRAVILLGPRRVGKTVMTQQLVKSLIDEGVPPSHIMYASIDTPTYTGQPLQFFVDLHASRHNLSPHDRRYIIFDEIQYLDEWERHLKVLVDQNPHIRFIASGSAAAALKLASTESGAGRFTEFMLPPLTFDEYLNFIGKMDLLGPVEETERGGVSYPRNPNIKELNEEFVNYINYGGYPEAVTTEEIRKDAARFIKNDIIDKVLLRDLPQLYGITNIQELNKLFTYIAYQTGQEISLETLAQHSGGISKPTIARYIEYLEAAFLIFRLKRVDESAKTFSRERTFKVYLTNPSMRAALFSPVDEQSEVFGFLVETAILSQWFHMKVIGKLHYARWKRSGKSKVDHGDHGEIDLIHLSAEMRPDWMIELKWSDTALRKPECWHSMQEFAEGKSTVTGGVFTSKTRYARRTIARRKVDIVPAAIYCFTVGRNTSQGRSRELLRTQFAKKPAAAKEV